MEFRKVIKTKLRSLILENEGDRYDIYDDVLKVVEPLLQPTNIDSQVDVLSNTLNQLMVTFDSEQDRVDFILDIVNEYKAQLLKIQIREGENLEYL